MRLVVLAAGRGSRLGEAGAGRPKAMVEAAGRPILAWQIETARAAGIREIVVVRGFAAEEISFDGVRYVDNADFATTNMVESLWRARGEWGEDFVVAYGDILYTAEVLRAVVESEGEIRVAVDLDWAPYWRARFSDPLDDAETLRMKDGRIVEIGRRPKSLDEIEAQYVGLLGFRGEGVRRLAALLEAEPEKRREWYMTDAIARLAAGGGVRAVAVRGGWLEIDTPRDLAIAARAAQVSDGRLVIEDRAE